MCWTRPRTCFLCCGKTVIFLRVPAVSAFFFVFFLHTNKPHPIILSELLTMASPKPVNLQEYADLAKQKIAKNAYDYYASGSNDMITLSENKAGSAVISTYTCSACETLHVLTCINLLRCDPTMPLCLHSSAMSTCLSVSAFSRLRILPRIFRGVQTVNTETTVLGASIPFPICLAPSAMQKMVHGCETVDLIIVFL